MGLCIQRGMPTRIALYFACMVLAMPLAAQDFWARKFSVTMGGGVGVPGQDLRFGMSNSPLIRAGVGYRFAKYFQADLGFDAVIHAAGVDFSQSSIIGRLRVRDNEFLLPFGGRAILPIGRMEFSLGGGGAYLHYSEQVSVPGGDSDSSYNCSVCTSRDGWGYYGVASVLGAVERSRRFWVGAETRLVRGRTSGDPLGSVPGFETKDTWVTTAAVFVVRFP
jgi:hypothetical protein